MLTIFDTLIDFIFPPRDTQRIIRALSTEEVLSLSRLAVHERIHYLLPYQTDNVRALIKENKFHASTQAATLLAQTLDQYLKAHVNEPVLLLPIPLSALRKKARGYNQVEQILKHLPLQSTVTVRTDILSRTKDTPAQTTLARTERLNNMRNVFTATIPKDLAVPLTIIIVDDVVTTGATLHAARLALTPLLPPTTTILCLALAH